MTRNHMTRCSKSLSFRERQIKTIMRNHCTCTGVAKIKNSDSSKCWWGCGGTGALVHCWHKCKMVGPLWKTVWQLKKSQTSNYYPTQWLHFWAFILEKWILTLTQKNCTQMFIAVLSIATKNWNQPRCLSIGEWFKKLG